MAALAALGVLTGGTWGCDRPSPEASVPGAPGDSATARTAPVASAASAPTGWEPEAGAYLVLPTVDGGVTAGSLLRPAATEATVGDTTGLGRLAVGDSVELFSRAGLVGRATLTAEAGVPPGDGCTAWPVARLVPESGVGGAPWTAALPSGRVRAVAMDSIEGLAPRDSAQLAAQLSRLASALPDDTSATFRGLPFVVLRAWRSRDSVEAPFVVATLVRRVNQEDNPLEERLVLVVDLSPPGATGAAARARIGWHERAAGSEEELVVAEPLLAYRLAVPAAGSARGVGVHLLFGRDDGETLSAAVLGRDGGTWRVVWQSAVAGCG